MRLLAAGVRLGSYEIVELVGRGGMGEVYKAFDEMDPQGNGLTGRRLATTVRAVVTFPGMRIVDDSPWKRVLEIFPENLPGLADGAIVAVATANRYGAVATFDRKLSNRLEAYGLAAYW